MPSYPSTAAKLFVGLLLTASSALAQPPGPAFPNQFLPSRATEPPAVEASPEGESPPLEERRAQNADQLRIAQRQLESSQEDDSATPKSVQREFDLRKQIDVVIAQQQVARDTTTDLEVRKAALQAQASGEVPIPEDDDGVSSFVELDHLRDELTTLNMRAETTMNDVAHAEAAVEEAQRVHQQRQRVSQELVDRQATDNASAPTSAQVRIAAIELKLAAERLEFRQTELANEKLAADIQNLEILLLQRRIADHEQHAHFTQDDLDQLLAEIGKREDDVKRSMEGARMLRNFTETQWMSAKSNLAKDDSPKAKATIDSLTISADVREREIALASAELERLGKLRTAWERRFQVLNGRATAEQIDQWLDETESAIAELERDRRRQNMQIDDLRDQIAQTASRAKSAAESDPEVAPVLADQENQLRNLAQSYDDNIVDIASARSVLERLHKDLRGESDGWTPFAVLRTVWTIVAAAWNLEVAAVDDRSITVGKVIIGVVLVFLGFLLARWISRTTGRVLTDRFGMPESGSAALKSLTFYVLLVAFALAALRFINVPLTVFTFLGGAIAIGIGFGSQNVVNNFISGLILLAERPIKVGDLIQVDDLYGNVEHIGARSTRIRTGTNLEIIVPNSKFLENNVVNLTLGDDRLRTSISVGVVYGSPTREVTTLLKRAAEEHGRVLNKPEPFVWFVEFGDNALIFELHFWVIVRNVTDRIRVESDVRYRIDNLFRDAGIVIAFPQCDMHVDTAKPLRIQVMPPEAQEGGSPASERRDAA